jgi:hypothetical protein
MESYELPIIALAGAILYPDKILRWLSEKTGRIFRWWHLVLLELAAIGLLILAMYVLMPIFPKLAWWEPLFYVGLLTVIRGLVDFSTYWFRKS